MMEGNMNQSQKARFKAAIAKFESGESEHPLKNHKLAVKCHGRDGCFTVAPITVIPGHKRYCAQHVPKPKPPKPEPNPTLEFLKSEGLPLTRKNYLDVVYLGNPPAELDAEQEAELPDGLE
jgi:hypothetical protein